jgi:hypothetical protein
MANRKDCVNEKEDMKARKCQSSIAGKSIQDLSYNLGLLVGTQDNLFD